MASGVDLRGAFLPVTTPFHADSGDVDMASFTANLKRWFEHPAAGLLISGSTGESVLLDEAERVALTEAAADAVPDSALVLGTSNFQ